MKTTATKEDKNTNSSTSTYNYLINNLLLKVQKPGQYLGIEWGHLISLEERGQPPLPNLVIGGRLEVRNENFKTWSNAKVRAAIIYPDLYELGMSNFGTKILYQIINNKEYFLCDRAYAPMKDMENLLRKSKVSLWGWESFQPLNSFDLLGFSLSYELGYTNVLNILELSHLETLSKDRNDFFPLIFAGGPATFNPEPMADFIDFFIIGDGEEVIIEVLNLIKEVKENHEISNVSCELSKNDVLLKLAQIPGIYVPKFYTPDPSDNYLPKPSPNLNIPLKITKRVVTLSDYNQPTNGLVPYLASVQDRQVLEIRRGCDRGCRFCQPGYVYLPVRERTPENLITLSKEALKNTGYDEYSLLSLSASDYTHLHELAINLNQNHAQKGISLSMPSQRADRFDLQIANELNTVRKSGITLAPEAGTERLRAVINKGLKEIDIKSAIENVYDSGFSHVKLYFMIGLPTETKEDLDGIINLLSWAYNLSKIKNKKPLDITCTISTFVPKAFTPFQWFSQNSQTEFKEKINYLNQRVRELKLRTVKLNCTNPKIALLEAVLSRGDRRMSKLIHSAFKKGASFDAWDEFLNLNTWISASLEIGLDLENEATKIREIGSTNHWDLIDTGLLNKFLIKEYEEALKINETSACTENKCHACGVCFELNVLNEVSVNKSNNNKFVKEIKHERDQKSEIRDQKKEFSSLTSHLSSQNLKSKLLTKTVQKIELIHTKCGNLRFISHLDVQRLFERALRRAQIPFSFTEGFNPRPKMRWLMPLPIYYESNYELLHLELSEHVKDSDLQIMLNNQLPLEFQLISCKNISLGSYLQNPENIKILYKVLTYNPNIWEEYICELKSTIENFLAQKNFQLKIQKNNHSVKSVYQRVKEKEKVLDIRAPVEGIKILNFNPLSLELMIIGNTRAELVLNQIFSKQISQGLENSEEFINWQSIWQISKEKVFV